MSRIEPPSDEVLCRFVLVAKAIGKCVYAVPEDNQWLTTEDDAPPQETASGHYYEFLPMGGRIQCCQVGTHAILEQVWWSDLVMAQYEREKKDPVANHF